MNIIKYFFKIKIITQCVKTIQIRGSHIENHPLHLIVRYWKKYRFSTHCYISHDLTNEFQKYTFEEIPQKSWSEYFQHKQHGINLARIRKQRNQFKSFKIPKSHTIDNMKGGDIFFKFIDISWISKKKKFFSPF